MDGILELLVMLGLDRLLFAASLVGLGILIFVLLLVVFAHRKKRGSSDDRILRDPNSADEHLKAKRFAAVGLITGLFFPWAVGLAMKFYLDGIGQPTYPISSFLNPVSTVILLATTVFQWCWPLLLLSLWVGSRHFRRFAPRRSFKERLLLAQTTYLGGLCAALFIFYSVFRIWNFMYVLVPIGLFLLPPMLLGYSFGILVLKSRRTPLSRA